MCRGINRKELQKGKIRKWWIRMREEDRWDNKWWMTKWRTSVWMGITSYSLLLFHNEITTFTVQMLTAEVCTHKQTHTCLQIQIWTPYRTTAHILWATSDFNSQWQSRGDVIYCSDLCAATEPCCEVTTPLHMTVTEASSGVKLIHHKKWPIKTKWKRAKIHLINITSSLYFGMWFVLLLKHLSHLILRWLAIGWHNRFQ